ncbi:beta-lactamase-like protein [Massariosphaeria phaeospora]|uniref:Beta-lactamase-like protein n=1 Tax=Massariosphaeria phaeospora TaxID=100035 RepID=A0A7C8MFT4_9PLEO|nr:beta-lactamase-like protein [Massariosphaeria phaeospora]
MTHTAPLTCTPASQEPTIHSAYEPQTGTWQYIVGDTATLRAIIIDPVLDYDAATHALSTHTADALLALVDANGYTVDRILETHVHADHLTAAAYLQSRLAELQGGNRPRICIGKRITNVQKVFGARYGVPVEEYEGAFDVLLEDGEEFAVGGLSVTVMPLPGHTPDHIGYMVGANVFCGDSLFHADLGSARCDFPGGSAAALYKSAQKLLRLPEHVKIWTGHDYVSKERATPVPCLTVRNHRARNKHFAQGVTQPEFVARREERDAMLAEPKLLHAALQVNIRAGRLPRPTALGLCLLHLPLKLEGAGW